MRWFSKASWIGNPYLKLGEKTLRMAKDKLSPDGGGNADELYQKQMDLYTQNEKNNPYSKTYDPRLRKYQMSALNRLQGIAGSDKLDAQSQAQLNQIRQTEGQLEKGSREAIMQNAAERGASSSTGNMMAQLMNQQGAAERRTNQDTDVAAMQQKRALDALYGSINTAKGVGDQDYRRAQANDLFNRYNITGKSGVYDTQAGRSLDKAAQKNQFTGQLLGTAGTVVGSIYGGPVGGAIGGAAGSAIGGQMSGGLQANNQQNPFNKKPGLQGSWQDEDYFNYGV